MKKNLAAQIMSTLIEFSRKLEITENSTVSDEIGKIFSDFSSEEWCIVSIASSEIRTLEAS